MSRTLTFSIFRHNPRDPASTPRVENYQLTEAAGMTLFIALNQIRENQAPDLNFDFVCRAGVCGSCAMLINGRPGLACRTLTQTLPEQITLYPLPGFALIADLSVNTGIWMREMAERLQTWVHGHDDPDVDAMETPMEPEMAEAIYELDRCIECGCCVAACGTAQMRPDFVAAVGLNKIADYYEVVGNDQGIFGCMSLLGCEDLCPKGLPLQTQLAYMRRKMAMQGVRKWIPLARA